MRIHAIGVNPYETYMRAGVYAIKPELPYTPGADAAGVIDQVGAGVQDWRIGQRVYISGTALGKAHGAYAQYAVCLPEQVHRLPDRISFAQGAGLFVPVRHRMARAVWPRQHARRRHRPDPRRERRRRRGRNAVRRRRRRHGHRHRGIRRGTRAGESTGRAHTRSITRRRAISIRSRRSAAAAAPT